MSKETLKYFDGPTLWEKVQSEGLAWVKKTRENDERIAKERAAKFETISVHRRNGLSWKEMAEEMGTTPQAVQNAYNRELKRQGLGRTNV